MVQAMLLTFVPKLDSQHGHTYLLNVSYPAVSVPHLIATWMVPFCVLDLFRGTMMQNCTIHALAISCGCQVRTV